MKAKLMLLPICKKLLIFRSEWKGKYFVENYNNIINHQKIYQNAVYLCRRHGLKILCLVFGFAVIGLFSMSSPLYTFNTWSDANVYLTTARQMLHGKMLYRDVFDHKGPYLYLIHVAAAVIDQWSFRGVYIMESAFAAAYALISMKTAKADTRVKKAMVLTGCLAVYGCIAFNRGDSAEEFCLPLLMASFYAIETENYFIAGLMAGCVFWIKMTICSFYVGWFIVMLIRHKADAIRKTPAIVLGLLVSSIPVAVMFAGNYDVLVKGYLISNVVYSSSVKTNVSTAGEGMLWLVQLGTVYGCMVPIAMTVRTIKVKKELMLPIVVTSLFLLIPVIYIGGMWPYYSLPLMFYAPLWGAVSSGRKQAKSQIIDALCITLVISVAVGSLRHIGQEPEQYKFVRIMKKDPGKVLTYGTLDYGFYTLMHQDPSAKYFFCPNMLTKEIRDSQNRELASLRYKYVFTSQKHIGKHYVKIAESKKMDGKMVFYLFKRTDSAQPTAIQKRQKSNSVVS